MNEANGSWPTLPLDAIASEMCLGKMLDKNKNRGTLQPYLRNVNVRWLSFDLSDMKEMRFETGEESRFGLEPGDLVICEGGEPGRAAVWKGQAENARIQKALHRVRFNTDEYDPHFAAYFLLFGTMTNRFATYCTGTTIKHLTGKALRQVEFPLPPVTEQRRIVAKIEELFSDLDAGVAALERAKANPKRYRAAVLKAAVEGKLTASESPAFRDLNWRTIDEAIDDLGQGWSPKCERVPSESDDVWGVIKTSAILPMGYIQAENKRLPDNLEPRPHLEVEANDVLMTRAGPRKRAAVTCMVKSTRPRLIVCDKVYRLKCNTRVAAPAFIELVLNAPQITDVLDELKTGISDSGVNLTQNKFRQLRIPIPDLDEQQSVIDEINRIFSIADESEKVIERGIMRAARLRQSILKRAFEGKLVPQDLTDEPASTSATKNGTTKTTSRKKMEAE